MEDYVGARVRVIATGAYGTVLSKFRGEYAVDIDPEYLGPGDCGIQYFGGEELLMLC